VWLAEGDKTFGRLLLKLTNDVSGGTSFPLEWHTLPLTASCVELMFLLLLLSSSLSCSTHVHDIQGRI
jgi:hypothetical protein